MFRLWFNVFFVTIFVRNSLAWMPFFYSAEVSPCTDKPDGLSCYDCKKIHVCPDTFVYSCEAADKTKPYCSKGACQSTNSCPTSSISPVLEKCPRVGKYPDPENCNWFHQCSIVNEKSAKYECPSGTRFDPVQEICYKTLAASPCHVYSQDSICKGNMFKDIPHPQRPDVHVVCNGLYKLQVSFINNNNNNFIIIIIYCP